MPVISGVTGSPTNTQTGGDEVYQWNGNGTITFSIGGTVQYLIVGGGGGGGGGNFGNCGGGGGAGGLLAGTFTVSDSTYTINVGAGGTAGVLPDGTPSFDEGQGTNGQNSSIVGLNSPAAAIGGGGGGRGLDFATLSFNNGLDGGSGGGEGSGQATATAGLGTTGQGNNGGDSSVNNSGGGGGGAGAVGGVGDTSSVGGNGGNGTASEITGTSVTYAGGGGGGGSLTNTGLGGTGGGGNGHDGTSTPTAGTDGLGGGGGGGRNTAGADGGDGIVIIRFTPETNNIAVISENTSAQNATPTVNSGLPYTGIADTHLRQSDANIAQGSNFNSDILEVTKYNVGDENRTLIRADGLSNIPANVIITSAQLYFFQTGEDIEGYDVSLRRMLQSWSEDDATWNQYDSTLTSPAGDWDTAGASGDGTDREATDSSTTFVGRNLLVYHPIECTNIVQDIVDGTITTDEGFLLFRTSGGNNASFKLFQSSQGTNNQRPELVVEYSLPTSGSGIKTIGTNGDFATISDWADAVKGENILSENAEGRLIDDKIYDYGNPNDLAFITAGLNFNGFTVTLRGFGSGVHNGSFGTGARIEASASFGGLYRAEGCIIEDFSITNTQATQGGARCFVQSTATIRRTIARTLSTGGNSPVIQLAGGTAEACYTEGGTQGITVSASGSSMINCTIVDADTGINAGSNSNLTVQNNVVYNCTTEYSGTFPTSTVSHNAGEDAVGTQPTEIQTDYVQITSADFVDAAGGDYSPTSGGQLDGAGTSTSVTTDLLGNAFNTPPSIGAIEVVGTTSFTISADTGEITLTGQDAVTRKAFVSAAESGAIALDGQDANISKGYNVISNPGSLTIDGQDAITRKAFVSLSDPGALTIDGQDAITRKGYNVISNAGSLLIDGQDASTRKGYNVVAEATTITIAGQDAGITKVYNLNAENTILNVGGQNATLRKSYNLVVDEIPILVNGLDANLLLGSQTAILAETGSFFVNGQDAILRVTRNINAEATTLDIEGQDAVTRRGYNVVNESGSFDISGQEATTRKGYNIISDSGNITNAGQDSILRKGYVHISESGSLAVAGQNTNLAYGRVFNAESGSIILTGQDADLRIVTGLRLTADPGAVQVIGREVQLGETTGNRLLRYSTLASGATALQHFLNINFGTGGGQIEIIETDRIHATVSEDVIVAEISEDIIEATIVENVITAIVSEDTLDSTIEEDTIQGSLTE